MPAEISAQTRALPRGPHQLGPEAVADSQRARLLDALVTLMADGGYAAVTIGQLARQAGVSRSTFYAHFEDKEACLLAAYDAWAARIAMAMAAERDDDASWEAVIERLLAGYLGAVAAEPASARAFIVEMDAAGPAARARRRQGIQGFAALLAARHARIREADPALGELPERAYLGLALGVRELVHDALEEGTALADLAPDVKRWIAAMVAGAR